MFGKPKEKIEEEVKVKEEVRIFRTKEEILTELKQKLKNSEGVYVGKNYLQMDKDYNFQEYDIDKNVNKSNNGQELVVENKIWGEKLKLEQVKVILEEFANSLYEEEKRVKDIVEYLDS